MKSSYSFENARFFSKYKPIIKFDQRITVRSFSFEKHEGVSNMFRSRIQNLWILSAFTRGLALAMASRPAVL